MTVRVEAKKISHNADQYEKKKNFEQMMKAFRNAVDEYGVKQAYKDHEFYEKPSEKKRRKEKQKVRQFEYEAKEKLNPRAKRDDAKKY